MIELRFRIEGGDFTNAGHASSEIKKKLKQLAIDPKTIKRTVVALYEAEVNIAAHAFRGEVIADINDERIYVQFLDEGPGIENIDQAMVEGYSTASAAVRQMGFGAGMGLANIRRNCDKLDIESVVGKGTSVGITTFFS
jgi:anti-sigma regulatory factor (Ser/Thr protein kinase)